MLVTDYLIIGAGAASMAFVDTLFTEQPNATIAIVDKHDAPGGHWNDAYDFVRLHQPSLLYGVASEQLEGSWYSLLLRGILPWTHRSSKQEILTHYKGLIDKWVASGRVQYFPNSTYQFKETAKTPSKVDDSDATDNLHTFVENSKNKPQTIRVRRKLVNGILGECRVPSQTPPQFPIDEGIPIQTPNELHSGYTPKKGWFFNGGTKSKDKKFVVLGSGKTALDTVVFLQREMGVAPKNIMWVVPNDIWMLRRSGSGSPWSWGAALLHCDGDSDRAALYLEEQKIFARLDKSVVPTKFRFPVVGDDELKLYQKIPKENFIRRGRVASIEKLANGSSNIRFTKSNEAMTLSNDHTFIHCTSPGPFNGNKVRDMFPSPSLINLLFLYAPPVPISMSCIAAIESRLQNHTLNMDVARKLLKVEDRDMTDTEVVNTVLQSYKISETDDTTDRSKDHVAPLKILAVFVALFGKDPTEGHKWLKSNRLSFFSVPGFKGEIVENLEKLIASQETFQYTDKDVEDFRLLVGALESLRGH